MQNKIVVRCRGVIIHENKVLVVKHSHGLDFAAFPGGHLEFGENPQECIERELFEELKVKPQIGSLLYTYSYISGDTQSVEFFFSVENAEDYLQVDIVNSTHAHEILECLWLDRDSEYTVLPEVIMKDFKENKIPSSGVPKIV